MRRRTVLAAGMAAVATGGTLPRPAIGQPARVLTFVPQANLSSPDPIWTTATVATIHGYMVWDTLYGLDDQLLVRPQMLAGHDVAEDGLTWRLTLREGLAWHDGPPVLARDCVASIRRWARRDGFGQRLMAQTAELDTDGDRVIRFRLARPFPQLPYALGASGCFMMPERIAATDAFTQIRDFVGSGPFRFLRDEWVSGASAAYVRNAAYVPRAEPASRTAGGKRVHFDRVEWKIMPDPATAAAALQTGEIDWWENPLIDLLPQLRRNGLVGVQLMDPLGALGIIAFNHTQPPFDNAKLRRALLPAVDQREFVAAVVGAQADLGRTGVGYFTQGSPYANRAGMAALEGPRDLGLARRLVAESGYGGEPVLLMSPSDQPQLATMAQVTAALFKSVGINVTYASMDWGSLVQRRASRETVAKGGWNCFNTTWGGLGVSNPGSSFPLRGNGAEGWFGWPTDPHIEALRDAWFDASELDAQQRLCEQIQLQAFENVPFIPVGQWTNPTAHRRTITGVLQNGAALMWNVQRV